MRYTILLYNIVNLYHTNIYFLLRGNSVLAVNVYTDRISSSEKKTKKDNIVQL